jgi:hypothetical protein
MASNRRVVKCTTKTQRFYVFSGLLTSRSAFLFSWPCSSCLWDVDNGEPGQAYGHGHDDDWKNHTRMTGIVGQPAGLCKKF